MNSEALNKLIKTIEKIILRDLHDKHQKYNLNCQLADKPGGNSNEF
jgi:hypothetical protein